MKALFVHNNFPGQYRRIVPYLHRTGKYEMAAVTLETNKQSFNLPSVRFKPHRSPTKGIHPGLVYTETAVIQGQALYQSLLKVKKKLPSPDIILNHTGWGSSMFLRDAFPNAKILTYYEWYYHAHDSDGEWISRKRNDPNAEMRIRLKNTAILHDLAAMDWGQCPTRFQHSQFPDIFKDRISVLHDGVDTEFFTPNEEATLTIGDTVLTAKDQVITYIARGMEEYRGFPQFMETVSILQKKYPALQVVVIGEDKVSYGKKRSDGKTWKQWALDTFKFDMSRLHFMGRQPLSVLRDATQITSAHIYLTAPFVLSWSMMETMATGALIVGSDTDPVREVIEDGKNGVLVPFWEPKAIAKKIGHILDNKEDYREIRKNARQTILDRYDVKNLLPKYRQLIESVANGSHPVVD
ncbi:glycosyl transferase [Kordiimonas sediminis]|uniref:Glycosyl transferase n=1 Tax=Kordiimonas sediminis TaxID=1735581 RepID=A0A919E6N2_9PROT|nr:glycosyltransferase [Kordiimonas sediminis]GHF18467.1 glycosyl transferase [Kordiimonas sediminis]